MRKKLIFLVIIAISVLPLLFVWSIDYLPFADYPNHLVRAKILKSYDSNEFFREYFSVSFFHQYLPIPNMAFDLFAAKLLPFIDEDTAGRIFFSVYVLLSLLSLWFFCREAGGDREILLLGYLPVIYGLFFHMALLNFMFSIPLFILAITSFLKLKKTNKTPYLVLFIVLGVLIYLSHIVSFVVLFIGLLIYFLLYRLQKKHILLFFLLLCVIAVVVFFTGENYSVRQYPLGIEYKLHLLPLYFLAYPVNYMNYALGMSILILYCTGLIWLILRSPLEKRRIFIIIFAFLFVYLALPFSGFSGTLVDARILPFFILTVLIYICRGYKNFKWIPIILFSIALLLKAYGSAIYYSEISRKFQDVFICMEKIENRSILLPVTSIEGSNINPYAHIWGYIAIKKNILTPYIFAGKYQPIKYRYNIFAPSPLWGYNNTYDELPEFWNNIKKTYDYVLIIGKNTKLKEALEGIGNTVCTSEICTLYKINDKRIP